MRIPLNLSFLLSVFLIIVPLNVFAKEVKYPYKNFNVKNIYRLDNGKTIFIEQTGWGNTIWEKINIIPNKSTFILSDLCFKSFF